MKVYRVQVEGQVQGVCFRHYTREKALQLGVTGWVRNCSDGSVNVLICGSETQLNTMLEWLEHGPPSAVVSQLRVQPEETDSIPQGFNITA